MDQEQNNSRCSIPTILTSLFFSTFILFCLIVVVCSFGWDHTLYSYKKRALIACAAVLFIFFALFMIAGLFRPDKNIERFRIPAALFLVTAGIRIFLVIAMGMETVQVSDFGFAFETAVADRIANSFY